MVYLLKKIWTSKFKLPEGKLSNPAIYSKFIYIVNSLSNRTMTAIPYLYPWRTWWGNTYCAKQMYILPSFHTPNHRRFTLPKSKTTLTPIDLLHCTDSITRLSVMRLLIRLVSVSDDVVLLFLLLPRNQTHEIRALSTKQTVDLIYRRLHFGRKLEELLPLGNAYI